MSVKNDIQHSLLMVSGSTKFENVVKNNLQIEAFMTCDLRKSAALARQCVLERYYDLIIIDVLLPDKTGIELAMDLAGQSSASILLVTPRESYEEVLERTSDYGILAIPKPFPRGRMSQAIRFLSAVQNKLHLLEKKAEDLEEKLEDQRIINKAKFYLVEKKGLTEEEAHRLIGKQAMDHGITRRRAAIRLMEDM